MDDIINIQVTEIGVEEMALTIIERNVVTGVKVNASPGFVLRNRKTGELRYFHSSLNNLALVERLVMIASLAEFTDFAYSIIHHDLAEHLRQKRPDSKWIVHKLTNITFHFYKIMDSARIGAPVTVPRYIKNNRSILSLTVSNRTGKAYTDNLCFFRCPAIALDCSCQSRCDCVAPRESHAKALCRLWIAAKCLAGKMPKNFNGISMDEVLEAETIFDVSIIILQLKGDGTATHIWKSGINHPKKLFLNLYRAHFSLIKDMTLPRCGIRHRAPQHRLTDRPPRTRQTPSVQQSSDSAPTSQT